MNGTIFNIQRFCTKDGSGIRTTVFLKGCPLHCAWCHNPEAQNACVELMTEPDEQCGYFVTADEVLGDVLKDKLFYDNSGGGLTLSGGEPFYQAEFCFELLVAAKTHGLHTCVETCGFTSNDNIRCGAELIDLFLFDFKHSDPELHKQYTGADNELILENLDLLNTLGKQVILRCPIIPSYNDSELHLRSIAGLANRYSNISSIEIEPYHDFGSTKYARLGRSYTLNSISLPDTRQIQNWLSIIQKHTSTPTEIA